MHAGGNEIAGRPIEKGVNGEGISVMTAFFACIPSDRNPGYTGGAWPLRSHDSLAAVHAVHVACGYSHTAVVASDGQYSCT